jgi:hypothetical protein
MMHAIKLRNYLFDGLGPYPIDGKGIGRIRLRQIPDASAESLHTFVLDSIQPGSVVHTDGWSGYSGLSAKGYRHEVTVLKGKKETASELLPRVHRGEETDLRAQMFGVNSILSDCRVYHLAEQAANRRVWRCRLRP